MNVKPCFKCGLHTKCKNPQIPMAGNTQNPEYVFVMPYPDIEDELGQPYQSQYWNFVLENIQAPLHQCAFVYLNRCAKYENNIVRREFTHHSTSEMNECYRWLRHDLSKMVTTPTIMTFGSKVSMQALADKDFRIMRDAGKVFSKRINNKLYKVVPCLDPRMGKREPSVLTKIASVVRRHTDPSNQAAASSVAARGQILKPSEAISWLTSLLDQAQSIPYVIFDIETTSLSPHEGEIIMYAMAHPDPDKEAYSIPLVINNNYDHEGFDTDYPPLDFSVTNKDRLLINELVGKVITTIPIVGHNLKFDLGFVQYHGVAKASRVQILCDTFNLSFSLQGKGSGIDNSLKGNARKFFDVTDEWDLSVSSYLSKYRLIRDRNYGNLPTSMLGRYAYMDAWYNRLIYPALLEATNEDQQKAERMITRRTYPFLEAELHGIFIDKEVMSFLKEKYDNYCNEKYDFVHSMPSVQEFMKTVEQELPKPIPEKITGRERFIKLFNMNNSPKMAKFFYNYLGVTGLEQFKNKTGYALDSKARSFYLEKIPPFIEQLRKQNLPQLAAYEQALQFLTTMGDYKVMAKLQKDYMENWPKVIHEDRYLPSFTITGTKTGRLSSPIHSIPRDSDLKRLIASRFGPTGGLILAFDFSNIEMRIVASMSREPTLLNAIKAGQDVHSAAASAAFGKPIDKIVKQERQLGKLLNFAILYGSGPENLAESSGLTVEEAKGLITKFYTGVPTLAKWKKDQEARVLRTGQVVNPFGRTIPVPEALSEKPYEIEEAKRYAVNYLIASSAADIASNTIADIWEKKVQDKMGTIFLVSTHDSGVFDVYPGELLKLIEMVNHYSVEVPAQTLPWCRAPLNIDIEIGTSWGSACSLDSIEKSDTQVVLNMSGPRTDMQALCDRLHLGYDVEIEVLSESDDPDQKFHPRVFFRDTTKVRFQAKFRV